jgi:hypothetical protein
LGVAAILARAAAEPAESPKTPTPAAAKPPAPAVSIAPVTAPAVKIEGLTKGVFQKLPGDALLDVGGRKIRKSDFVADFKRQADAPPVGTTVPSGLNTIRARVAAEEDKAIADSAAEVRKHLQQGGK